MGKRKVAIEINKEGVRGTGNREREVAVRSGSRGRLGSLSMGSARFFFKRGVNPLHVGRCACLHLKNTKNVRSRPGV